MVSEGFAGFQLWTPAMLFRVDNVPSLLLN